MLVLQQSSEWLGRWYPKWPIICAVVGHYTRPIPVSFLCLHCNTCRQIVLTLIAWLHISHNTERVQFKLCMTVGRCMQDKAPRYLKEYCISFSDTQTDSRQRLHSASRHLLSVEWDIQNSTVPILAHTQTDSADVIMLIACFSLYC